MRYILSIDQGTTSSRSVLFDEQINIIASSQKEIVPHFPELGWVEQDAKDIWRTTLETIQTVLKKAKIQPSDVAAIGITNQRETVILWDRETGEPVYPAIVWQDRRTASHTDSLRKKGYEKSIHERTGLLLDPYFSASKLTWLLDHEPNTRKRAERGELAAGTVDSWLAYQLSGGKLHITDVSNASRTMLFNINKGQWDKELLELFKIPEKILPTIVPTSGILGHTDPKLFGAPIPIGGMIGDQQSALFGQLCTEEGMIKCTYGTGCFMLLYTGLKPRFTQNRLVTTIAWQIQDQPLHYALEGSVFVGGAAIQWLRDGLKLIKTSKAVNELAAQVDSSEGVIFVPAFTGLGAPYWDAAAQGAFFGITRGTTSAHFARAALEGIAFQVSDLAVAMTSDHKIHFHSLRVDGGAAASNLLMQIQADQLGISLERPKNVETTVLGAAFMAGLAAKLWPDVHTLSQTFSIDQVFHPKKSEKQRHKDRDKWHKAVQCARQFTA